MKNLGSILVLPIVLIWLISVAPDQALAQKTAIDSTGFFRDLYLPPGLPSVALQIDENAIIWNPSAIGLSQRYYIGYAWKGIYRQGKKVATNHFFLTKSRGLGFGFMHDSHSVGVKTTTLLSIAPPVSSRFSIGFTGRWRGGFNFDFGATAVPMQRIRVAIVGRNLRQDRSSQRYIEAGLAGAAISSKVTVFADVIFEETDLRKTTTYGGGIVTNWGHGFTTSLAFLVDQDHVSVIKAGIRFHSNPNIIEGEYWKSSNRWSSLSARISYESQ